MQLIFGLSV